MPSSIAIIGGAGFVGSAVASALVRRGSAVTVLTRLDSSLHRIAQRGNRLLVHRYDHSQPGALTRILLELAPRVVIDTAIHRVPGHAAEPRYAADFFAANTAIAFEVAEALRVVKPDVFIQSTTQYEYRWTGGPIPEEGALDPASFFGITKTAASLIYRQAARDWGFPLVTLRLFTVYGPGEPAHRLIPSATKAGINGHPLPLTAETIEHDWVFIDDVVDAYLAVLDRRLTEGTFNIATGLGTNNQRIVQLVEQALGKTITVAPGAFTRRPVDHERWYAAIARAREKLGWSPRIGVEVGVRRTVAYWREQLAI